MRNPRVGCDSAADIIFRREGIGMVLRAAPSGSLGAEISAGRTASAPAATVSERGFVEPGAPNRLPGRTASSGAAPRKNPRMRREERAYGIIRDGLTG